MSELNYLRAMRAQLGALLATMDARVMELCGGEQAEVACPSCGSSDLAPAGDVLVCGGCNENIPLGEKE